MPRMLRALAIASMLCGCGGDSSTTQDAGLDAQLRLALTVDGPTGVAATRSLRVTITTVNSASTDTFAVGGLPATVDLAQPVQLNDWTLKVDGYDMSGTRIGFGQTTVPARTAEAAVTLAPL